MHFPTIVSLLAATLGAVTAAPSQDGTPDIEARQRLGQVPLLRLHHLPNLQGASFTGVGTPNECANLPRNVNDFRSADAAPGFRCNIYTEQNCRGSTLTVGAQQAAAQALRTPSWRSWRCTCAHCR